MDCQGIIALYNKMNESSNINNWNRVRLDMVHEGLDGRLVPNWWENILELYWVEVEISEMRHYHDNKGGSVQSLPLKQNK